MSLIWSFAYLSSVVWLLTRTLDRKLRLEDSAWVEFTILEAESPS